VGKKLAGHIPGSGSVGGYEYRAPKNRENIKSISDEGERAGVSEE